MTGALEYTMRMHASTAVEATKQRKRDAEAYDRMRATRPLTPPSYRFAERTSRAGEREALRLMRQDEHRIYSAGCMSFSTFASG